MHLLRRCCTHLWTVWLGNNCLDRVHASRRTHRAFQLEAEVLESRDLLSGTGLTAQYFSDQNLHNLVLTRTDATINFDWAANQAPAAGLSHNHFSVRWRGYLVAPGTGLYRFMTRADDGVRLTVNGQLLINNWTDHPAENNYATLQLTAGKKYSIEMVYYQNAGRAVAQLFWTPPGQAREIIRTSQLYPDERQAAKDTTPPTASLQANMVTVPGAQTYTFQVIYRDNVAVLGSSLHTGNVMVTGPNRFVQIASLVKVDQPGNGGQRIATYQIRAPGGAWSSSASGAYQVSIRPWQVKDTSGNYVRAGSLGTIRVVLAGNDWFDSHLHDPSLASLVRRLDSDGSLSRNDMLAIFGAVEKNGVTARELSDLQTLVKQAGYLGMADYVRDLTAKVAYGDAANAALGGGNLHPGSTGGHLEQLVGLWFLGPYHPAPDAGLHYVHAAGSLFGNGPAITDIVQGKLADCYFLAALGEVAQHAPSLLRSMFIDNGDGTYTVRFYHYGVPDYVTVDRLLPVRSDGTFAYANMGQSSDDGGNTLWVALAEKAYAQLAESGWSRGGSTGNGYHGLDFGWEGYAIYQLTGHPVTAQGTFNDFATFSTLVGAVKSGNMIGLDSNDATTSQVVPNHAYVLLGYNGSTHMFTLYNPWGSTVQLSWGQVTGNFSNWSSYV